MFRIKKKDLDVISTYTSYFLHKGFGNHYRSQMRRAIQLVMGPSWCQESLLDAYYENNYVPTVLIHGDEENLQQLKTAVAAINTLYHCNNIKVRVYTGRRCKVVENFDCTNGKLSYTFKY